VIDECFISFDRMLKKLPVLYLTLYIALLLGLFCPTDMMAQKGSKTDKANNLFHTGKWGLEVSYMTGQFLKHGIAYNPPQLSQGIEVDYFMRTLGEKPWHKAMNFPEIGAALTFYYFADNKVFGDAISIMAFGKFFMVRSRVADFYMRIGGGYGYLTRRYNSVSNPVDQLISTPVNLAVQLRMGLDWKINPYLQINTAISFNHFSNSGMNLPNYGLNIPAGTIGIRIFPKPMELGYNCEHDRNFKKNEIMWKYSIGVQQLHSFVYNITPSTRKYPVPGGMIAYARYINYGIKFYGGLSFEYFPAIHDYLISNDIHTRYGPSFSASAPSAIIGNEFILGRMSMFYSAGVYLWENTAAITPLYFKIGMNLYLAEIKKRKGTTFFFGNSVKAHTNVAQYNEFSVGGTF
jgi:hypothetical protein